jgi:hypothetical protein
MSIIHLLGGRVARMRVRGLLRALLLMLLLLVYALSQMPPG